MKVSRIWSYCVRGTPLMRQVIFLNDNPISWKSQKQTITARSASESEYVALSAGVAQLVYVYQLLCELGFNVPIPVGVDVDNTAAIRISENPQRSQNRSKLISTTISL
jgi:hypothetical protein